MGKNKVTIADLMDKKRKGEKITMLTAYDYPTAALVDQAGIDTILVGDSLFMDTVEAALGNHREFGLVRVYKSVTDIGKRLKSFHPDLVIFDLNTLSAGTIFTIQKEQPGTPMLGLDINTNEIIVMHCQSFTAHSVSDLTRLIDLLTTGGSGQKLFPPDLPLETLFTN